MSFICEIFPAEVIRLLISLEERGVRVSVGEGQLVIEPASRLTPNDRALVTSHLELLVLAAAFATDFIVRQVVADYPNTRNTCPMPNSADAAQRPMQRVAGGARSPWKWPPRSKSNPSLSMRLREGVS